MRELLGRTLHDIVQILESCDSSDERILGVLERLGRIVPYAQCALLHVQGVPRLLCMPPSTLEMRATLTQTLVHLHRRLVDERAHPLEVHVMEREAYLAVPLVGNDQTMGLLFVSGASSGYTEQHLRELSIVGAQLASYIVMVERDRTLHEARHDAEAANRMKDEFLAIVSRELKTPLTSTLLWAKILGSGETDEILELGRVATAGLRLELEAVDPSSLIEAAVAEQRERAAHRSIRLETSLDGAVKRVVVDPARIVLVLSSLLAKAIHFTPSGGQVGIRLQRTDTHARIQVIDDGRKFPAEVLPRLFEDAVNVAASARLAGIAPEVLTLVLESFHAGHDPVTRAYGDQAVRLAIVKTLVEAHGGRVRAESPAEGASTFTFELPLPPEALEPGQPLLAGIRVLLVDDDEPVRSSMAGTLGRHGAEVTTVGSAAAARVALERSRPHVLLSALSMPGESGYELMRKVAARDAALPAAALIAVRREEDRSRAFAAGFRMHLERPFDSQALVTVVATLTGRPSPEGSGTAFAH